MIEVQHLTKRIGQSKVLDDVTLCMAPGRVTGLVGPNGSGKTMLMRVIAGLVRPTSGRVVVGGYDAWARCRIPDAGCEAGETFPTIGLLLEGPAFLDGYTGLENLKLLASIRGRVGETETRAAMSSMGLDPDDGRRYRKYSLGMKQRLGIAGAMMERPDVLLLDEPTNALDTKGVDLAIEQVCLARDRGAAVVLASHDPGVMHSLADEVWHLAEGHVDGHEVVSQKGGFDG